MAMLPPVLAKSVLKIEASAESPIQILPRPVEVITLGPGPAPPKK